MRKHLFVIALFFCLSFGAKLRATDVSVVDYGADPTGTNDTTTAFNNALSYAKTNGVNVYVPSGVYIHSNIIKVDSVQLYGDGYASQIHGTNINSAAIQLVGSFTGISKLRITALSHSRMTAPWNDNVWCASATNFTIDSITVEPNSTYYQNPDFTIFGVGGMIMLNCSYGVISNNFVHWTWADAIHNTDMSNNILITNNTIHNPGDDSIAVVSYGGNAVCHDITIVSNTIYNTTNRGITVIGGRRVKIADNSLSGMVGGGIWLAGEGSYNTSNPVDVQVLRNSIVHIDNYCNASTGVATLPAMGFDSSNGLFGIADNLVFADNYVESGCRDLFRISGNYVDKVILVGNSLMTTSHPKMVFFTNPNVTVYSAGNTMKNSNTRFYYTANIKNHFATNEKFYNLTSSNLGAICYQYDTTPQNIQITSPTTDSSIQTFLHLSAVSGEFYAFNTPNVPLQNTGAVPPIAYNWSLSVQNNAFVGAEFTIGKTIFQRYVLSNKTFELVAVYQGIGGTAEIAFDKSSVKFKLSELRSEYSFQYLVAADFGISAASVQIAFNSTGVTGTTTANGGTDSTSGMSGSGTVTTTAGPANSGLKEIQINVIAFVVLLFILFV